MTKENVLLWLKGLGAATLGGAVNALAAVSLANIQEPLTLAKLAATGALLAAAAYIKQSPVK